MKNNIVATLNLNENQCRILSSLLVSHFDKLDEQFANAWERNDEESMKEIDIDMSDVLRMRTVVLKACEALSEE